MRFTFRLLAQLAALSILWGAPMMGCSPAEDPSDSSSGGFAGDATNGGQGAGGKKTGSGGDRSSGGAPGGGQTSTGGTGTGGSVGDGGSNPGSGGQQDGGGGQALGGSGGAGSGGSGSGGVTTCDGDCRLAWPLLGEVSRDWTVTNYVDLDPGAGILDFQGGDRSYDGHRGVDIAIASLRAMDRGVAVYAAAPGVVTAVHDGESDRNLVSDIGACSLVANSVYVTHPDGREARYLHFRKNSIEVEVGQKIATGDKLGEVGSSGCSSSPHLHLELTESPGGALVDPFAEGFWIDPPDYDAPPKVMEVALVDGMVYTVEDVQLAPPNPTSIPAYAAFSVVVITGGTQAGVVEKVDVYRDGPLVYTLEPYTFDGSERYYMRWWPGIVELPADLRLEVKLDDELAETVEVVVE